MTTTPAASPSAAAPGADLVAAEEALLATVGVPVERGEVQVQGTRLHYLTCGEGEPLVLVHGRGTAAATFAPVLAALSQERRVLALDLPGWGLSEKPSFTGHTPQDALAVWRDGLLGFLDALDIAQTDLLGHSLGGLTALSLALEHPERIHRLLLEDSGGLGEETPFDVRLFFRLKPERLLRRFGPRLLAFALRLDGSSEHIQRGNPLFDFLYAVETQPAVVNSGARAFDRVMNMGGVHLDLRTRLKDVEIPTLLLWGDRDRIVPYATALHVARRLRTARLVAFTNTGHLPHIEKPAAFARVVVGWLDGYSAPTRV